MLLRGVGPGPARTRGLRLRARCRLAAGRERLAWQDLVALQQAAPDDPWPGVEQAKLRAAHGDREGGLEQALAVARAMPQAVDAWRLAEELAADDPRAGLSAEIHLGRAAAEPGAVGPACRAAEVLWRLGRAEHALALLDTVPDGPDVRRTRIAALLAARRDDELGAWLDGLGSRDPDDGRALARAALIAGRPDLALAHVQGRDRAALLCRLGRVQEAQALDDGSLELAVLLAAAAGDWPAVPTEPPSHDPATAALQAEALRREGRTDTAHERLKATREQGSIERPGLLLALFAIFPNDELYTDLVRSWRPLLPADIDRDGLLARVDGLLDGLGGAWDDLITWREGGTLRVHRPLPGVRRRLADLHGTLRVGGFAPALARFDDLVAELVDHPLAYTYRGELHLWSGDLAAARRDMDRALSLDPSTRWAWVAIALIQAMSGEGAAALATLTEGERHAGKLVAAAPARCEALLAMDELDACDAALAESLRLRPRRVSAWLLRAIVARRRGRADPAIEHALAEQLPVLWRAGQGDGLERLESLRAAMGGNRSSTTLTFRHPRGGWVVRDTVPLRVSGGRG